MAQEPTTAYTEIQIDEDSISLTLMTESQDGVTIEDTERLTFDELQSLSGEHRTLSLSGDSQSELSEQSRLADIGQIFEQSESGDSRDSGHIQKGDVVKDKSPASWSQDDRVKVTEVLSEVTAEEYVIQGPKETPLILDKWEQRFNEKTVADANPSYPATDTVILGKYVGGDKEYGFPESRLVQE